ncbi:DUF6415 family natural product biosynthesis protein [Streptomyces sp. NPDC049577]|uniref:DUF6415 family natural product biosynthesis protein n=1 Tax=Streptomyces sp. NPDC049577 TaxID=3155153 RepID=UPI00341CC13B
MGTQQHEVIHHSRPDEGTDVDVVAITQTISTALQPVPAGHTPDPGVLADLIERLSGHITLLLPIATEQHRRRWPADRKGLGLVGYGLEATRRRMRYAPPSPDDFPLMALRWVQESARACQTLLGVVGAADAHQHTGAAG